MQRLPEFRAILEQFPWGRFEKDNTFIEDVARGRFNVLGGTGTGFWSHRGGPIPHLPGAEMENLLIGTNPTQRRMMEMLLKTFAHLDGAALLEPRHLTDRDGWRLEPEFVPYHHFTSLWEPPRLATKVDVKDWDGWYRWRRLPKESPAALLMTFPISIYWMLAEVLKVADPKRTVLEGERIPLVVHYIGAEVELNYLPLFSELALLLPHHDIQLIMFGNGVKNLLTEAKKKPNSVAAAALKTPPEPVYTYTAPEESGSAKLAVYLDATSDKWSPSSLTKYGGPHPFPDALVAPNAGLGSYPAWHPVVVWTLTHKVPFAVTEYAEQSCETQRMAFRSLLGRQAQYGTVCTGAGTPTPEMCIEALMRARSEADFPIVVNPFQRPGQRPLPTRVPNVPNGFVMVVMPFLGEASKEDKDTTEGELSNKLEQVGLDELD
ncbi:hypothetical protein EIP86_000206 [Pleurotus ostreatoroseus]|nr:hypothetical protein EIP86_000206 [Pleurotus ostreatoroseus]